MGSRSPDNLGPVSPLDFCPGRRKHVADPFSFDLSAFFSTRSPFFSTSPVSEARFSFFHSPPTLLKSVRLPPFLFFGTFAGQIGFSGKKDISLPSVFFASLSFSVVLSFLFIPFLELGLFPWWRNPYAHAALRFG